MGSEKLKYILSRRGPDAPVDFSDLLDTLTGLGAEQLAALLWSRAHNDEILRKTLTVLSVLREPDENWDKVKQAINYALYFPESIRYDTHGHELILDEILTELKNLRTKGRGVCRTHS